MRFDRMDRVAIGSILALAVAILFFVIRGDQVGVQITRAVPDNGSTRVPTRGLLAFTFSEAMSAQSLDGRIQLSPETSGTVRWNGNTAFFVTSQPLQADTAYTLTIRAGASSTRGRQLLRDEVIAFRTGHARVVFLSPADGTSNLIVLDPSTNEAQKLTNEPFRIYDFAISPDGSRIVYSLDREQQDPERDIWIINSDGTGRERLVQCDGQACQAMSWSGDGTRIAYERRNLIKGTVGRSPGAARVWLADVTTKETAPLFSDEQLIGSLPRYAPSGDRIAFYNQQRSLISVVDSVSGSEVQLPSVLGDPGAWSPDGNQIVFSELQATEVGQSQQLLRADLVQGTLTNVLPISNTNDGFAVWSPDGDRLAFSRQSAGTTGVGSLGPQLWVTKPDGSDARALTQDGEFSHGSIEWSPDGQWLVYQRFNLLQQGARPEVWLIRADGSERRKLADDATLPGWIP